MGGSSSRALSEECFQTQKIGSPSILRCLENADNGAGSPTLCERFATAIVPQAGCALEPYGTHGSALEQVHSVYETHFPGLIAHNQRVGSSTAPEKANTLE